MEGVDLSDSRKNDIDEISSCIGDDGKIRKDSSMYSQSGRRHTANAPVLERQQTNGERRDSEGNGSDKELLNYSVEVKVDDISDPPNLEGHSTQQRNTLKLIFIER